MRIKILVIDDEDALCEILKFNLEKEGYEVDCAYSAEEALAKDLSIYQLFIVDIMMERLSGFDFAKRVRNEAATESTPIIFCSALTGEDDTVMGLNIGADDYITKPFVISEVLARVPIKGSIAPLLRGQSELWNFSRKGYIERCSMSRWRDSLGSIPSIYMAAHSCL